jgi:hypothetical protein
MTCWTDAATVPVGLRDALTTEAILSDLPKPTPEFMGHNLIRICDRILDLFGIMEEGLSDGYRADFDDQYVLPSL